MNVLAAVPVGHLPFCLPHPRAGARTIVGEHEPGVHRVLQEAETAEREALDLVDLHGTRRPWTRPEQQEPAARLLFGADGPQPLANRGVRADVGRGQRRIGRVPAAGRHLLTPRPPFEAIAIGRALLNEVRRLRKAERVGPDARQSRVGLGDEVFEIALPAAAVIRKKHEVASAGHHHPPREMDRPERAEPPGSIEVRCRLLDQPEDQPHRQRAQRALLHDRDARQVVLRGVVFARLDARHDPRIRRAGVRHVGIFTAAEPGVGEAGGDQRHDERRERRVEPVLQRSHDAEPREIR